MIKDLVTPSETISIRLISKEEWDKPRCGTCFARIGETCAITGKNVTLFGDVCGEYDKE